jgi:hypothetical protein
VLLPLPGEFSLDHQLINEYGELEYFLSSHFWSFHRADIISQLAGILSSGSKLPLESINATFRRPLFRTEYPNIHIDVAGISRLNRFIAYEIFARRIIMLGKEDLEHEYCKSSNCERRDWGSAVQSSATKSPRCIGCGFCCQSICEVGRDHLGREIPLDTKCPYLEFENGVTRCRLVEHYPTKLRIGYGCDHANNPDRQHLVASVIH